MLTLAPVSEEFFSQSSETSSSVGPMPLPLVDSESGRKPALESYAHLETIPLDTRSYDEAA